MSNNDRVWTDEEKCAEDTSDYESCVRCGADVDVSYGSGNRHLVEGEYTCTRCAKSWARMENGEDY